MVKGASVFLVLTGALAFAGCSHTIDASKAERSIKAGLEGKARRGVSIAAVSCPTDVSAKKGNNFACTVKATNGKTAKVTVEQTDDKGHVTYSGNLAPLAER